MLARVGLDFRAFVDQILSLLILNMSGTVLATWVTKNNVLAPCGAYILMGAKKTGEDFISK